MGFNETIGIDVSKLVIDVYIHGVGESGQFKNDKSGFKKMFSWVIGKSSFEKESMIFVFEHTGLYSAELTDFFQERCLNYHIVCGLEIKRSLGISRGKADKIDAKRIALYAYRRRDELLPCKTPKKQLKVLKSLHTLRDRLVKQKSGHVKALKEQRRVYDKKDFKTVFEVQEKMIKTLAIQIGKVEDQISSIIEEDEDFRLNFRLVTSIKGIGKQTANTLIIYTDNFTKFETWRNFASYCGIAPFPYQSGTSVRGRTKVSHLANKNIKSILYMCAMTAIQYNPELKQYYDQRIKNGKNKMSTINVVKNKLVSRVFAVVRRQTPYVDTMKFAA